MLKNKKNKPRVSHANKRFHPYFSTIIYYNNISNEYNRK
jgi:hypothetical protein